MSRLLNHNGQPFHVKRAKTIDVMSHDEKIKRREELQWLINDAPGLPPDSPIRKELAILEFDLSTPVKGEG